MVPIKIATAPDSTHVIQGRDSEFQESGMTSDPMPRARSMHDGVAVWEGCGSCGAEPYWIEIGAELMADQGSDEEGEG